MDDFFLFFFCRSFAYSNLEFKSKMPTQHLLKKEEVIYPPEREIKDTKIVRVHVPKTSLACLKQGELGGYKMH